VLRVNTSGVEVEERQDRFLQGVKDCVPTLLGYLSIGFAAGVIGHTSGLSIAEVLLMSLLIYAGSAQFIVSGMIAAQGPAAAIIVTVFVVNLRHLLLSAAISPYFRHLAPIKTLFIGSLLTDETFGVAMGEAMNQKKINEKWMYGLNITAYLNWILATVAGAYFGQWMTSPEKFGLDFALSAMFIGLLVIQIRSRGNISKDLVVAVSAVVVVTAFSLVLSGSMAVIAATVIAATIGVVIDRWK